HTDGPGSVQVVQSGGQDRPVCGVEPALIGEVGGELVDVGEGHPTGSDGVVGGRGRHDARQLVQGGGAGHPGAVGVAPVGYVAAAQDGVRGSGGQIDPGFLCQFTDHGGRGGLAALDQ